MKIKKQKKKMKKRKVFSIIKKMTERISFKKIIKFHQMDNIIIYGVKI